MAMEGKLVHTEHMRMRWGDMDALGHMNNTVYFRYLEQARISWFDALNIDYNNPGEGPILGSVGCRFRIPVVYPADLNISVYASKPRNSSFVLHSAIAEHSDPTRIYATSEAIMVWIDLTDGKSRPLPDWMKQHLAKV